MEIKKHYGLKSEVIELPIDTKLFLRETKSIPKKNRVGRLMKKIVLYSGPLTLSKGFDVVEPRTENPGIRSWCLEQKSLFVA